MVMPGEKLAALKSGDRYDFLGNKSPKCPHCGEDFDVSENEAWWLYNDNDNHTVECPRCDNEFQVVSHSSWTFSTDEQDDEDG